MDRVLACDMTVCKMENSTIHPSDTKSSELHMCETCSVQVHAACTLTQTYVLHGNSCCAAKIHHLTSSGHLGQRKIICDDCVRALVCARPVKTSVGPMVGRF